MENGNRKSGLKKKITHIFGKQSTTPKQPTSNMIGHRLKAAFEISLTSPEVLYDMTAPHPLRR